MIEDNKQIKPDSIEITSLGKRKVSLLVKLKRMCIVCKKETNQDLILVHQKQGIPIIIPLLIVNFYESGTKNPEFFGCHCNICGNVNTLSISEKKREELMNKYSSELGKKINMEINIVDSNSPVGNVFDKQYEIKTVNLGQRDIAILTHVKMDCIVCKKETQNKFVFIYEKRGYVIPIGFSIVHNYPDVLGYICENCGYTLPFTPDSKARAEITSKYHVDSHERLKVNVVLIMVKQIMDSELNLK